MDVDLSKLSVHPSHLCNSCIALVGCQRHLKYQIHREQFAALPPNTRIACRDELTTGYPTFYSDIRRYYPQLVRYELASRHHGHGSILCFPISPMGYRVHSIVDESRVWCATVASNINL